MPTCSPPLRAAAGRLPHRFALAQGAAHGAARRAAPGAARSRPLPCGAPWRPRPPLPLGRHGDGRGRGRKPSAGAGATPRGSRRAWGGAGRGGRWRRARRAEAAKGLTRPAAPELNPPAAPRERPGEGGCRLPAPSGAAGWGMLALQKPSGGVFEISVLTTDGSYQEIRVREEDGKCKRSRRSDEASHHPAPSLPGSGRDLASLS